MRCQVISVAENFVAKVTRVDSVFTNPLRVNEVAHRGHGGHLGHCVNVMMVWRWTLNNNSTLRSGDDARGWARHGVTRGGRVEYRTRGKGQRSGLGRRSQGGQQGVLAVLGDLVAGVLAEALGKVLDFETIFVIFGFR